VQGCWSVDGHREESITAGRYLLGPRKVVVLLTLLSGLLLLNVSCSAETALEGECISFHEGESLSVPCVVDGETGTEMTEASIDVANIDVSGSTAVSTGGKQVFLREGTCYTCHMIQSVPQAVGQIGPDLSTIGLKGEEYIRQSIIEPNAAIAESCPTGPCLPDVMPATFSAILTAEQIDSLVGYLAALK
jgi:mono/diheme cytochrome c family protein